MQTDNTITAVFNIPKMKTKKVWIGGYGGHYEAIVIFNKKPVYSKAEHNHIKGKWIDLLDNKENIAGCLSPCEFKKWFGVDVSKCIKAIEPTELIEINITACFDKYNKLENCSFDLDGWQS